MRASQLCVFSFVAICVLALAGCGGSSSGDAALRASGTGLAPEKAVVDTTPVPSYPAATASAVHKQEGFLPQPGTTYLYVANQSANEIDVLSLSSGCQAVATISEGINGPYGLWFDTAARMLYVANQSNNTVTAYVNGSATPLLTYSQDLQRPLYPIADDAGNVYVGNAGNGTVVEYFAGTTTVYRVLQTPGIEADGLAFDRQGNLYVAYRTGDGVGQGGIEEFAAGSSQGQVLAVALTAPQGLVLDTNGNLVATETEGVNSIDVFPAGAQTPSYRMQLPNDTPTGLAIDAAEANLYVSALSGTIYDSQYPLPGQSLSTLTQLGATIQGITISDNQNF